MPQPITLLCDNRSAEHIAHNQAYHERTKHLKLDCYYIRENIDSGFVSTSHVNSTLQLADILTKSLSSQQHDFLSAKSGLVNLSQVQLEGGAELFVLLLVVALSICHWTTSFVCLYI